MTSAEMAAVSTAAAAATEAPPQALRLEKHPDGVAVLWFDTPGSRVNILSRGFFDDFARALDEVERDASLAACVLASAKDDNFIGGANLKEFLAMTEAAQGEEFSRSGHALLDRMERSAKPYVAAIHGVALGGGLEVALACRLRIATDDPKTALALPEAMLGLLPGGGGTQRLPRLVGLVNALPLLLTGRRLRAAKALRIGLVDLVVPPGGLVETAAAAARALVGGTFRPRRRRRPLVERIAEWPFVRGLVLRRARSEVAKKTRGLYPAPFFLLDAVAAGLGGGFAKGEEAESVLFGRLTASPESKSLIHLFEAQTELKKAPDASVARPIRRLGVVGAGLMGEGIASVSLPLGEVALRDVSPAALSKAARNVHLSLARRVRSGSLTRLDRDRQWNRLRLTTRAADLAGADLVIEAVFEELSLKRKVIAELEAVVPNDAVIASNTSALPIAHLAAEAAHPERIVGMHYFSPVPKMPLLEVVAASRSADWAVATARAFGMAQGKTVIVVKDGPGFYTTRVLAPLLNEAVVLLDEGAEIAALDAALLDFGFPVGPVTLLDEVGIDVAAHVSETLGKAFAARGLAPSARLSELLAAGFTGRKGRKGFFSYADLGGGRTRKLGPNAAIRAHFSAPRRRVPPAEMAERLTLLMANEAVHALADGTLASPRDGDVGAVFGLGFPPFRGGPFRHLDAIGAARAVERLDALAAAHGPHFAPAPLLAERAASGRRFYA